MTKTSAMKRAIREITMYQQGPGWVIRDEGAGQGSVECMPRGYMPAKALLARMRCQRALELLGVPDAARFARKYAAGTQRERINLALDEVGRM